MHGAQVHLRRGLVTSSDGEHCSLTSSMLTSIGERHDLPSQGSPKMTLIQSIVTARKWLVQPHGNLFTEIVGRRRICACVSLISSVLAFDSPEFNTEETQGQVRCRRCPNSTTSKQCQSSGNRRVDRDARSRVVEHKRSIRHGSTMLKAEPWTSNQDLCWCMMRGRTLRRSSSDVRTF